MNKPSWIIALTHCRDALLSVCNTRAEDLDKSEIHGYANVAARALTEWSESNHDAATIAAYVALLDRLEHNASDPKTRELARRVQGNVWKLATMT